MKYLTHISEDKQREQSIKDHLEEITLLAKEFAEEFGYGGWGYFCGLLYGVGKYSTKSQGRIMGNGEKADHTTAEAQLCLRLGKEKGSYYVAPVYYIAGHHADLLDIGTGMSTGDRGTFAGRTRKKVEDYRAYQEKTSIPPLPPPTLTAAKKKDLTSSMSFLIRMLYSCPVDADYLSTEDSMKDGETSRITGETILVLLEKLSRHIAEWLVNDDQDTINGWRTEILKSCIEKGKKRKRPFHLTAPTGGGKTMASLTFALNCAMGHGMKCIIYVAPYTGIVEQNTEMFSRILGEENVLEHHSGIGYENTGELKLKQLAVENWDLPIVVTTNVQFFESLFSSKSSKCRKLRDIANSVIIFDKAQMLPNDYLRPCIVLMEELIHYYENNIVLCMATQPSLRDFFPEDTQYTELYPRTEEQFRFFKRAIFKNLGKITEDELINRMRNEGQALCILNTKNNVQRLYEKIKGERIYHLLTFMHPRHRQERPEIMRERLTAGEKCIVIATSPIKAGVDLDFQTVYRELAGMDSMIQAVGRCNREGKRDALGSFVCYFQLEESRMVPGQEQQIDTAKQVIRGYEDIGSLDAVQEYFTRLYQLKSATLDKRNIPEEFQKGRFAFTTVGEEFKLIEQNTETILTPAQERTKKIAEELKFKDADKKLIRGAGKYCVSVYGNLLRKIYDAGIFVDMSEELKEDFFVLKDYSDYSDETSLQVKAELGMDI